MINNDQTALSPLQMNEKGRENKVKLSFEGQTLVTASFYTSPVTKRKSSIQIHTVSVTHKEQLPYHQPNTIFSVRYPVRINVCILTI